MGISMSIGHMQSQLESYGGQGKQAPTLVPSPFWLRPASLVSILSPKNVRYELRDSDLVYAWDVCNI
jgi:hypothetical protein